VPPAPLSGTPVTVSFTVSWPDPGCPASTARRTNLCLPAPLTVANPTSSGTALPGGGRSRGGVRLQGALPEDALKAGRLAFGGFGEARLGDPHGRHGVLKVGGVTVAVVLEGGALPVEVPAIALDDQVVLREEGVGLPPVDLDVDLRSRQAIPLGEGEEVILELGLGGVAGVAGVLGERSEQLGRGVPGGFRVTTSCSDVERSSPFWRALLTSRFSWLAVRRGARSKAVRAGLVVGIPHWRVMSCGPNDGHRWVTMPRGRRSPVVRAISGGGSHRGRNPHRKAAEA
jgi:hypothetical protein